MKINWFTCIVILIALLIVAFLAVWVIDNFHPYNKPADINISPLRMVFVGDIMLSRRTDEIITRKGPEFPFEHVHDILQHADIGYGKP